MLEIRLERLSEINPLKLDLLGNLAAALGGTALALKELVVEGISLPEFGAEDPFLDSDPTWHIKPPTILD